MSKLFDFIDYLNKPLEKLTIEEYLPIVEQLIHPEQDAPENLYHYTTASGLLGIIKNQCLWSTDAKYLNDFSEIKYGLQILKSTIKELTESEFSSDTQYCTTLQLFLDTIFQHLTSSYNIYFTCFCSKGNLLSQWRAYGKNSGFALEFSFEELSHLKASYTGKPLSTFLAKIVYDEKSQKEILRIILRNIKYAIDKGILRNSFSTYEDERKNYVLEVLHYFLLAVIPQFKDNSFSEEEEWRLITYTHKEIPDYE